MCEQQAGPKDAEMKELVPAVHGAHSLTEDET